jgi:hypothetical protein
LVFSGTFSLLDFDWARGEADPIRPVSIHAERRQVLGERAKKVNAEKWVGQIKTPKAAFAAE